MYGIEGYFHDLSLKKGELVENGSTLNNNKKNTVN